MENGRLERDQSEEGLGADVRHLLLEVVELRREIAALRSDLQARTSSAGAVQLERKTWLTVDEAALLASAVPKTVRRWIKTGRLKASKPRGGRQYRVNTNDLVAFLAPRQSDGAPDADEQVEKILRARGDKKKG